MKSDLLGSFAVRVLTLPLSAVFGLITTSIVVEAVGAESFGYVALIGTVFLLLPFADLGVGASVVNAFATKDRDVAVSVLAACTRVLLVVAVCLAVTGCLLGANEVGTTALGVPDSHDSRLALTLCVAVFAFSVPFGLGQRILLGVGKNAYVVGLSAIGPLGALAVCWLMIELGVRSIVLSVAFPVGLALSSVITFFVSLCITRVSVRMWVRSTFSRRPPGSVFSVSDTAIPMFVISVGLPIALQSDRLIIAHQSTPADLAAYSVAAQLYAPLWAIASTTAMPLWPRFARLRSSPDRARNLWRTAQVSFLLLSIVAGVCYFAVGPQITHLVGDAEVLAPPTLYLAFGFLLVAQTTHLPNGMLLTNGAGLSFQAACVIVMVVLNIALSIYLTPRLGAAGPVVASAAAVFLLQSLPAFGRIVLLGRRYSVFCEQSEPRREIEPATHRD